MASGAASTSYNVGLLTISDTASRDPSSDRSGPLLAELFSARAPSYTVTRRAIVPDDIDEIQRTIRSWTDTSSDAADIILCSGGTGFGQRDVTPEAIDPLLDKKTNGLTHALTNHSLSKTPLAALSRYTTGIRHRRRNTSTLTSSSRSEGSTLVIALPGSPKAVRECCEILLADNSLLTHALDLIAGGDGKAKHKEMQLTGTETDTGRAYGHSHHDHHRHAHVHGHAHHITMHSHHAPKPRTSQGDAGESSFKTHDPTQSVSGRHRSSPYPIITMDQAIALIDEQTGVNEAIEHPVSADLRGYILAQDVHATRALPPRPTTNVDGYALVAAKIPPGTYRVVTKETDFTPGNVFRINTGQALPSQADGVIMVEDTELVDASQEEEITIKINAQLEAGENVRRAGSDVQEGQLVLRRGTRVGELGGEIGTLAFLGYSSVKVHRKPKVAILSTGNELYDVSSSASQDADAWGFRVFDSNRPSLSAALQGAGFQVIDLGITGDDVNDTLAKLNEGLEQADVILSTGGTSMGESDLLKPLIERRLKGGKMHFGRVAMKPGKPTTFASALSSDDKERLLFALPGNPASALVCFYVFVMPCLRKLSGYPSSQHHLPKIQVTLLEEMRCDPRPEYHRVIVRQQQGQLCAASTGSQRSSGMHSMATANGLVCVPSSQGEKSRVLQAGSLADVIILGPIL